MGVSEPRIRASSCKRGRAALRRLFPDRADEIFNDCAESNRITETTPGHGWIALAVENQFVSAMVDRLGPRATRQVVTHAVSSELDADSSLIGGLYESTVRLFGLTPNALAKALPPSFRLVYRDVGELKYRKLGSDRCLFELSEVPVEMQRLDSYFIALTGIFDAIPSLCRAQGEATFSRRAPDSVCWEVAWDAAS